jgi:hypothetical protein
MSRYTEAHLNPSGPGDARPIALQIIKNKAVECKLVGKVIIITGTSSGIGIETARALSLTDARLLLTARDLNKAKSGEKPGVVVARSEDALEISWEGIWSNSSSCQRLSRNRRRF